MPTRAALASPLAVVALALAGCGGVERFDIVQTDAFDAVDMGTTPTFEAGTDTSLLGRVCQRASQCDDGIPCTDDSCGAAGRCVNVPFTERCDDRLYCNGAERCDVQRGCVGGEPVNCNDNNVCTADRCVESTRTCDHRPLDRDGDGDPDDHCAARECGGPDGGVPETDSGAPGACWRGHDCDDSDPRVSSLSPEICGDMVDNNCNGRVDSAEPGGCRAPAHDRCDDPLDVSAGGVFGLAIAGLARDYTLPCAGGLEHDFVARLRLTEPRNVVITGASRFSVVALALQSTCGGTGSATLECSFDYPAEIRRDSLPAGEYFIIVGSSGDEEVDLDVRLTPATPAATNDTCATATVLPGAGSYPGTTVGLRDDYALGCNAGAHADAVYQFTLTSPQDVTLSTNARDFNAALALTAGCAPVAPLRCGRGFGAAAPTFRARSLPAGTYRVIVETGRRLAPFVLTLGIDPPTMPATEDACPAASGDPVVELNDGLPHVARISSLEDDYTLSCDSFRSARDAVYRLTIDAPSDVRITASAASGQTYASFRSPPCAGGSERRCVPTGGAGAMDVDFSQRALAAGTYWLVVENTAAEDVTVRAVITPPSPVVTYALSDSPAGVSYVDACSMPGARRLLPLMDDATSALPEAGSPVTIPFPLRMYGVDVVAPIAVSTNGWMSLSRTTSSSLGGRIPDPADPNMTIAPYWSDLYTRAVGVCYAVTGTAPDRALVVQWDDLHFCCSPDAAVHLTFQAVIREAGPGANNVIDVVYQRMDGADMRTPSGAGIENDDGTDGTLIPGPFTAPRIVRLTPSR